MKGAIGEPMIEGCMICSGDLLWLLLGLYTVPCEYMYICIYVCIHLMPFGGAINLNSAVYVTIKGGALGTTGMQGVRVLEGFVGSGV